MVPFLLVSHLALSRPMRDRLISSSVSLPSLFLSISPNHRLPSSSHLFSSSAVGVGRVPGVVVFVVVVVGVVVPPGLGVVPPLSPPRPPDHFSRISRMRGSRTSLLYSLN